MSESAQSADWVERIEAPSWSAWAQLGLLASLPVAAGLLAYLALDPQPQLDPGLWATVFAAIFVGSGLIALASFREVTVRPGVMIVRFWWHAVREQHALERPLRAKITLVRRPNGDIWLTGQDGGRILIPARRWGQLAAACELAGAGVRDEREPWEREHRGRLWAGRLWYLSPLALVVVAIATRDGRLLPLVAIYFGAIPLLLMRYVRSF